MTGLGFALGEGVSISALAVRVAPPRPTARERDHGPDDIGLLPAVAEEAQAIYRLVDAAYEKRSLIVTSNLQPARFDTIFPKGLATAAVDRLLHHAQVIVIEG
jgi:hypothetical protein